jgi:hypothetical protein
MIAHILIKKKLSIHVIVMSHICLKAIIPTAVIIISPLITAPLIANQHQKNTHPNQNALAVVYRKHSGQIAAIIMENELDYKVS